MSVNIPASVAIPTFGLNIERAGNTGLVPNAHGHDLDRGGRNEAGDRRRLAEARAGARALV